MNATVRSKKKIERQKQQLRDRLWPNVKAFELWNYRDTDGWLNVPRTMPLLLRIMDSLAEKGKPVSTTYFELWCRTFNDSFVIANKHREMAMYAGFGGERAVRTWMTRIKALQALGFIDVKEGPSGAISYVLIPNPYKVIKAHRDGGRVSDELYHSLVERMIDINARDLDVLEGDADDESKNGQGTTKSGQRKSKAGSKQSKVATA